MMRWVRCIAAVALLAAAGSAAAFIRETTGPDPRSGTCQWWGGRNVTYQVNASGVTQTGCAVADAEVATEAAFDAWNAVTCSDFTFEPANPISTSRIAVGKDGVNLVVFRQGLCGQGENPNSTNCWSHGVMTTALTTTTYDTRTGQILDSDIELNAREGSDGMYFTCSAFVSTDADVQAVVGHEAGHMLGLDHPCEYQGGQIYPGYPNCDADVQPAIMWPNVGSVSQRELKADDIAGVCAIYPASGPTLTCPPMPDESDGGGCCSTGGGGAGTATLMAAAALAASRLLRRRR